MRGQRRSLRFVAVAVVVALPLLGTSAVASAKAVRAAKGCHKTHTCKSGGGGTTGSGTGTDPDPITVQIDPNPLVETGQSDVVATVQVEASPSLAGDQVTIASSQLYAACGDLSFLSITPSTEGSDSIELTLDDDGNATVLVQGTDCAPGPSVFEASLVAAPYDTALGTLMANPPVVTAAGVFGYPTTSGTVTTGEVETGDGGGPGGTATPVTLFSSITPGFSPTAVPAGICSVTITASGGQGGDAVDGTLGGDAATVMATVPVTPGTALDVEVGGAGASPSDGGAGGIGGGGGSGGGLIAGGGGGASAVSSSGTPLVVAGGGGGASFMGSVGGVAGKLGNNAGSGGAGPGTGGSGGSSSGVGGAAAGGGGGGGVNGGGAATFGGGAGGGGNGSVGGGGGGADPGTPGGVGGVAGQTGASGPGFTAGGIGDDGGGNGGSASLDGGGGGGGVGFGGGGGGDADDGGGGGGFGGGGGGVGPSAAGGGGSSYVTPSVIGTPSSSNTSTGDGSVTITYDPATDSCGGSDVYAVFYVETNPVYAEEPVEISSPELQSRCGTFSTFDTPTGLIHDDGVTTTLDDDGNAVFYFMGASCAAGSSVVTADVEAGAHPTYTTTFNIVAPQPTI